MKEKKEIQNNNHDLKNLIQPGVANTDMIFREYLFTADNELDYTVGIIDATMLDMSADLPAETVSIFVWIRIADTNNTSFLEFKRNVGDAGSFYYQVYANNSTATQLDGLYEIPTDGNTLYTVREDNTCGKFVIFGYKVKV